MKQIKNQRSITTSTRC